MLFCSIEINTHIFKIALNATDRQEWDSATQKTPGFLQ